jgi:hypothetical protein
MTAASIYQAANDPQLQNRVMSIAQKEIVYNTHLAGTAFGQQLQAGFTNVMPLMWPIAADQENAYAAALQAGRGAPGHDRDIITDEAILSGVISFWPYAEGEGPPGG